MLMDFETELDRQGVTRVTVNENTVVTEEVKVARPDDRPDAHREHLVKEDSEWEWRELRDYVITNIEERIGAIPRDPKKEKGIFESFCNRWGAQASAIARYAFEIADGRWRGAPIHVTRFCKGSDPYFAEVISERLK